MTDAERALLEALARLTLNNFHACYSLPYRERMKLLDKVTEHLDAMKRERAEIDRG